MLQKEVVVNKEAKQQNAIKFENSSFECFVLKFVKRLLPRWTIFPEASLPHIFFLSLSIILLPHIFFLSLSIILLSFTLFMFLPTSPYTLHFIILYITFHYSKGAFTQSVLRGVIRRRLGYVINKKYFFIKKTTILRRVIRRGVNAT